MNRGNSCTIRKITKVVRILFTPSFFWELTVKIKRVSQIKPTENFRSNRTAERSLLEFTWHI
jgi:hypothetical protein